MEDLINTFGKTIKLLNSKTVGLDNAGAEYTFSFSFFGQNGILTKLLGNSIEEKEIPLSSTWIYITSLMNGSYFGSRIAFNVQGYKYNLLINIRK